MENYSRNPFFIFLINFIRLPELFIGNFGSRGLGWLDTVPPLTVPFLIICLITWIISRCNPIKLKPSSIFLMFSMCALPLFVLQRGYNYVGEHVQPRYLLPLMISVFISILLGGTFHQMTKVESLIFIIVLGLVQSLSLYANISRYSVGIMKNFLTQPFLWNWPGYSPRCLWFVGSICALVFYWLVFNQRNLDRNSNPS